MVDVNGGGNYTTVNGAVGAATTQNGNYQIIAVSPGVYTDSGNVNFTIASTKPKLLIIGTSGAAATIIDGEDQYPGWTLSNTMVIASLTFRKTTRAFYVNASGHTVRLVDLFFWKNAATNTNAGAIHEVNISKLDIIGCTLLDNTTNGGSAEQIYLSNGTDSLTNTVVYGASSGTMLYKHPTNVTFSATYSLVKGMTLSGTGNLSSSTDPKLRFDGHVDYNSPLIGAGVAGNWSASDIDLDARGSPPGIGADEWKDTDSDSLADFWETAEAGNLTTLTSLTQDQDSDGRTNNQEYLTGTKPTDSDTDDDGLNDGGEATNNTDPFDSDSDDDDLPDGWEVSNSLNPLTASTFEDPDHDRYGNIYEYVKSSNPQSSASTPSADLIVDQAQGGSSGSDNIYTTIGEAITAATTSNGAYQIVAVHAGTYQGTNNINFSIGSTKPKLLVIGTAGANATVVDGGGTSLGWTITNSAVISSMTFKRTTRALYVNLTSAVVRLVDLVVRNNAGAAYAGGLHVTTNSQVNIFGSTFLDNTTTTGSAQQIYLGLGTHTVHNTVVWGASSGTSVAKHSSASWTWSYSQAKGQTLSGTGNLSGSTDPKLRPGGRLLTDSPLRGAGGDTVTSRLDLDLENRPSSAPDIGADQWNDSDSDGLPDGWELLVAGNLTALNSGDTDGDGLSNYAEYAWFDGEEGTDPLDPDTDGDQVEDGIEVAIGTDPLIVDSEDLSIDYNQDGLVDPIGLQIGYLLSNNDDDGDSISNADELEQGTDPLRADTDGDTYDDDVDAFPLDPLKHAFGTAPGDTTAPVITLTAPKSAVLQ